MIYLCFENNVSVLNVHERLLRSCDIKYMQYLIVMGSSAEQILSLIVAFNIYFSFFNPIIHFLANSSSVTKWCFLFVIVAYPFLIIDNLIFPISLSTMRSWVNLIYTISIALSKSWMAMSSWVNITVGSQGVWLLTGLIYMRLNTIWSGNVSTCLNLFICGVISNKSTCGSHCQHLDMGIKICINSQCTVMIGRVITDWYSRSS